MANINFQISDEVIKKAEAACDALGLSLETAVNIYLVKLGNEMRIPFEVSVDPFYSTENQKILQESIAQLNAGHGTLHEPLETN